MAKFLGPVAPAGCESVDSNTAPGQDRSEQYVVIIRSYIIDALLTRRRGGGP